MELSIGISIYDTLGGHAPGSRRGEGMELFEKLLIKIAILNIFTSKPINN